MPYLWYPLNVLHWPGRIRGAITCIMCICAIIFRKTAEIKWVWLGLSLDFLVAMTTGAAACPISAITRLLSIPLKRMYEPGTPKQAGLVVSGAFAAATTVCFFWGDEEMIAASILLGMHAGATFLAAGNFCAVCVLYDFLMKSYGFPPPYTVEVSQDAVEDIDNEQTEALKRVNPPPPKREVYKSPTGYTIEFTKKGDDYEREDMHLIKRTYPEYFISSLCLSLFAFLWKEAQTFHNLTKNSPGRDELYPKIPDGFIDGLLIASIVWALFLLILYLLKIALYPHRFLKDMQKLPNFLLLSGMPCTFLIISRMLADYSDFEDLARGIYWVAMPVQVFISVFGFGRFVSQRTGLGTATPIYLLPSFGLLLCGVVSPDVLYDETTSSTNFGDLSMAFFGTGIGLSFVAPICFMRMIFNFVDFRLRPSLAFFPALTAAMALGVQICAPEETFWFTILVFASFILYCWVFATGLNSYFMEGSFHFNHWILVLPTILLAFISNQYFILVGTNGSKYMAHGFMAASNWFMFVVSVDTLSFILTRKMWVPIKKFGPLTLNKTFHYYFRGSINSLHLLNAQAEMEDLPSVTAFVDHLELFLIVLKEHAVYEENVLFPYFRAYFPGITSGADEDHQRDEGVIAKMFEAIKTIRSSTEPSEKSASLQFLQSEADEVSKSLIPHLDWEEENLNWIVRKFFSVELQKEVLIDIVKSISFETWRKIIPHMMHHIPIPSRREKLIRCLMWALPDYTSLYSVWMEANLSPYFLTRTIESIPEIIPRSHWNHKPRIGL